MTRELKIQDLVKTFDNGETLAVDGVSFSAKEDEITALLGPSGCGKTTTLRCVAGVETIDSGSITLGDEILSGDGISLAPERRNLGMVFQNYAIWPHKTVHENIMFSLKYAPHNINKSEYDERVKDILELIQIPHLQHSKATDLSGGQQQRVALARALVHDPDLLLLDEPLSNLDAKLRSEMRNEIQRVQQELGISILYVTHDQEEAFYLADNVQLMRDGHIVEGGSPIDLYTFPDESFTRHFVGHWNRIEGKVEDGAVKTPIGLIPDAHLMKGALNEFTTDNVTCFIRPTDTNILLNGDESTNSITVEGKVIAHGIIGELQEINVECNGADNVHFTVQQQEHSKDIKRGDELKLSFDARNIQVYEA